jgi:DNA invertase Pin-like site-specific DNA recombinase
MKLGLIYSRVSTDEQAKEGQSIDAQIKLCNAYMEQNGYTLASNGIYKDEGKSGSNTNRPGLQDLLLRVSEEKNIEAVFVLDTDRLARNTLDHLKIKNIFKKHNVTLVSISQPMIDDSPEGNFIDVVLAGANALQSQITGRKTSKVMEQKVEAGWWAGVAPLGYVNSINPHPTSQLDKRIVTPDPEKAPLITKMFQLHASGSFALDALVEKMESLGLTAKNGGKLQKSLIHHTLRNPFYYGKMMWKGKLKDALHEPLIDYDTWLLSQKIMNSHNQNGSRKRKHNFLLNGFLYCETCQGRFYGEQHLKGGKLYRHYHCGTCKKGTYTDIDELEKQVEKWFGKVEMTEQYANELRSKAKDIVETLRGTTNAERQALVNQKTAIEVKIRNAEDNLLDGTFKKDQYQRVIARLEADLESIEDGLAKTTKDYSKGLGQVERLINMAENIKQTYHDAEPEMKREYLDLFFSKFMVQDGKIVSALPSAYIKPLIANGKLTVRVRNGWLPRVDSNHEP